MIRRRPPPSTPPNPPDVVKCIPKRDIKPLPIHPPGNNGKKPLPEAEDEEEEDIVEPHKPLNPPRRDICDAECKRKKKEEEDRKKTEAANKAVEKRVKTIAFTPPGSPGCAGGNPALCRSTPSKPTLGPGGYRDLTTSTGSVGDEIYKDMVNRVGTVVGNATRPSNMDWFSKLGELGLPGSQFDMPTPGEFIDYISEHKADLGHFALDMVGLVPIAGELADVTNAAWYAADGDYVNAGVSLGSAIPIAGWGFAGVKTGVRVVDAAKSVKTSGRMPSCRTNSFVPGTKVVMADGSGKPIEQVRVGDRVLATDPETGQTDARRVTDTIVGEGTKRLVAIDVVTMDSKAGSVTARIVATDGHPFYEVGLKKWIKAEDLKAGSKLRHSTARRSMVVSSTRHYLAQTRVHNLTVETHHTYYVLAGATPVLVHNANCIVGTKQFDHAWDQHSQGGAYYKAGKMENVFAGGIDKARFRGMVDEAIKNGTQVPRSKSDPRGGYYIDYDFGDVEVGTMGQNGMRVAVDGAGNFVTAMPRFIY